MNSYGYVRANPLRYTDPLGLREVDVANIVKEFEIIVGQMTREGLRLENAYKNNLCRKFPFMPMMLSESNLRPGSDFQ